MLIPTKKIILFKFVCLYMCVSMWACAWVNSCLQKLEETSGTLALKSPVGSLLTKAQAFCVRTCLSGGYIAGLASHPARLPSM